MSLSQIVDHFHFVDPETGEALSKKELTSNPNRWHSSKVIQLVKNKAQFDLFWDYKISEQIQFHQLQKIKLQSLMLTISDSQTVSRLKQLMMAHQQLAQTIQVICPDNRTTQMSTQSTIPSHQSLSLYFKNVFRDWGWQSNENKIQFDLIDAFLPKRSSLSILQIGCGAGRLAADLAHADRSHSVLAMDINPFLLGLANRMNNQEVFKVSEIKRAPIDLGHTVIEYELKSIYPVLNNLGFLLADALDIPLESNSVDCVVTSWLIDVIPMNLPQLASRINRVLKSGGVWINSGPLGYSQLNESDKLSKDEIKSACKKWGFRWEKEAVVEFQYLNDKDSGTYRNERVLNFSCSKVSDVEIEQHQYLPKWFTDRQQPIPLTEEIKKQQVRSRIEGDLLNSIDGKVNINSLVALVGHHYGLSLVQSEAAVLSVFRQLIDKKSI